MDRPPSVNEARFARFVENLTTLQCIKYLVVGGWILRAFSILYNIFVLSISSNLILKSNLRLFLVVFTVIFVLQGILSVLKNRSYFAVTRLIDVQDNNEIGLLGNFLDAVILFWCLTGYHWIAECDNCKILSPLLYYTCYTWAFVGAFMVISPLIAIILLLVLVTCCKPKLPVILFKTGKEIPNHETTCSICLTEYEKDDEVKILPCNHNYHKECIDNWFNVDDICPTCRKPVNILFGLADPENV
ncbi:RING-H2 finger protein ATL5 [Cucumispora dikerogammari]|nr:RING-H2 finger protein ATL5 [Cucumispora dikerogammari]